MQSTALPLSPSTPFLKPGPHPGSIPRKRPTVHLTCIKPRKALVSGSSYGSITGPTVLLLHSNGGFGCKAGAASVPVSASESEKSRTLVRTLQLGSMFSIWYLLNIYYNIFNKQVLKVFPFPATITAFQFGFGTLMVILMCVELCCFMQLAVLKMVEELAMTVKMRKKKKLKGKPKVRSKWKLEMMILSIIQQYMDQSNKDQGLKSEDYIQKLEIQCKNEAEEKMEADMQKAKSAD